MQKKNIAIICSWLDIPKGVGSFFVEQAELVKDNFDVSLVHFKPYRFGLSANKKSSISITITTENLDSKIPVYTIHYPEIKFFNISFLKSLIEKKAQKKLVSKINKPIDLLHAQSLFDAGFWSYKLKKNFDIPYIFTEHNQLNLKGLPRKKDKLLKKVIANASEKLVVSDDLIRQFASNEIFADFHKLGNTFDETCFKFIPTTKTTFTVTTIGAYTPIKDTATLLNVLKIIDQSIDQKIIFNWIGYNCWGTDNTTLVNKACAELNFKNIEFNLIKSASKQEIANYLQQSDILVSTSICETFGLSVLEALACGVPVVCTNSGGVLEMITPENGIICPIKNPEVIAQNILKINRKESVFDAEKISENIKLKFGSTTFTEKLSAIYNQNAR